MLSRRLVKINEEGLVKTNLGFYFNYKQGYNDATKVWSNLGNPSIGNTSISMVNNPVLQSGGVYFNGTNNYGTNIVLSSFNGLSSWSAEVFLGAFVDNGLEKTAFSIYFDTRYQFYMGHSSSGYPFAAMMINNIYYNLQGLSKCTSDSLLTFTMGSTGLKLYLNGVLVASKNVTGTLVADGTSRYTVGARQENASSTRSSYFLGRILAVRVYTKELSIGEVIQNYSVGNAVGL